MSKDDSITLSGDYEQQRLYESMCRECDSILKETGVMDICIRCSTIEPFGRRSRKGCCAECMYLGEMGCTTLCLACKLWFCSEKLRQKILSSAHGPRWVEIENIVFDNHRSRKLFGRVVNGHRMTLQDLFDK